jgi:capsular polysaccharide biosynthesis protein/GGDEF domain-containing protein
VVLQQLIKAISGGWKWIVMLVLIAVVISSAVSAATTPIYRSQATFIIAPNKNLPSSRDVVSAFSALDTLKIFSTYADILASERVYAEALKAVNTESIDLSQYERATEMKPESIILALNVDGPDPQTTAVLANEIGKYGIYYINSYFTVFEIDFLDQAVAPSHPVRPQPYRNMAIAAGAGLLVSLVIVIATEFMQIPLNQFIQRFSLDGESLAITRHSLEKTLIMLKKQKEQFPISVVLVKITNLDELFRVLPGFSRKMVATEIVKRFKDQLKGNDLVGRWEEDTFSIFLPHTPKKASAIVEKRLAEVFSAPFTYGVEDSEQVMLDPLLASATCQDETEFDDFVKIAEASIKAEEL